MFLLVFDFNQGCGDLKNGVEKSYRLFVKLLNVVKTMALTYFLLSLFATQMQAQSPEAFPQPAGLKPAVDFWIKVYTEVDTQSGYLHDSENLSIIYERLRLNRRNIEASRNRIREDLRYLATGSRDDLSRSQREILELWPADVSNSTLLQAANNIRWQLGQSDRFLGGLRRSGAFRDHIQTVIREKNLPSELGVLPHVESSFNPNALSSASAAGMWQFTSGTGKRFMRIDYIIDERMDPYTSTAAAMSLLEYNYSVLGTWPLALTAYNHGAGGISRAVRETGTTDIEKIVANYRGRRFGFASRNFYAQFLAVVHVENNARQYFGDVRYDSAPNFFEVETDAYIDAEVFANSVGVSFDTLKRDNPALRPIVWEGNKRIPLGFPIKVRRDQVDTGDLLALIPADYKFAVQTPDIAYVVERGDTLSLIASRFDTSVNRLVALNQLASRHRISIGQRILLPQEDADPNRLIAAAAGVPPEDGLYTVSRGDTVSRIADRYNLDETALLAANGIQNPNLIYPGQQIRFPGYSASESEIPGSDALMDEVPQVDEGQVVATLSPDSIQAPIASADLQDVKEAVEDNMSLVEETELDTSANRLALNTAQNSPSDEQAIVFEQEVALDPAEERVESSEELSESLSADPSDYSVANNSIEIQASETLGHYADWLEIRAWDIRRLNNMAYRDPVIIGERISLEFSKVNIAEFELRRQDYHVSLQREFFATYRIQGAETYKVRSGDNIGGIAQSRYSTPIWLLRQYNPGLDFNRIQIDQEIVFPLLERVN